MEYVRDSCFSALCLLNSSRAQAHRCSRLGFEARGSFPKKRLHTNVASFVLRDTGDTGRVIITMVLIHIVWRECTSCWFTTRKVHRCTIVTLSPVSVALCHCDSFYCCFGTKPTNFYFRCIEERVLGLLRWWEIKCNESNRISDSQDELEHENVECSNLQE